MQDVANPISLRPFYCMYNISPRLFLTLRFSRDWSNLSSPSSCSTSFLNFQVICGSFSEVSAPHKAVNGQYAGTSLCLSAFS